MDTFDIKNVREEELEATRRGLVNYHKTLLVFGGMALDGYLEQVTSVVKGFNDSGMPAEANFISRIIPHDTISKTIHEPESGGHHFTRISLARTPRKKKGRPSTP